MSAMLASYTFLIISAIIGCHCESLGPPPGSAGTIDYRFPNIIVSPLPDCPTEGVYPHPRNCTWYYRCYDRLGLGIYWRAYFQCEPGTVFADALDQCVFPHTVPPPCGIYLPVGPPAPPVPINTPAPLPIKPPVPQQISTAAPLPPNTPAPPLPAPSTPLPPPSTPAPPPPSTPSLPTTTPAPPPPPPPTTEVPQLCETSYTGCTSYEVCPEGESKQTKDLCITAFEYCPNGTKTDLCVGDMYYDIKARDCVPNPESQECTIETTFNIVTETTIRCSESKSRPHEDWIDKKYCNDYILCHADGRFKGLTRLCNAYYQCIQSGDKQWQTLKMACDIGLLYSFNDDACVSQPGADELCAGK